MTIFREEIEWLDVWVRSAQVVAADHPRVLCIGDSVTRGWYGEAETGLLAFCAPARLCTSRSACDPQLLRELELVLNDLEFSLIHVNNGLHGWDHSERDYQAGMQRMLRHLTTFIAPARIIVAATTPQRANGQLALDGVHASRIVDRNRLARELALSQGMQWNPLHALADAHTEWFADDGVHFQAAGCRGLADACIASIRQHLIR